MQWGATECGQDGNWRNLIGFVSAGLARAVLTVAMIVAAGTATVAPTLLCPDVAVAQDEEAVEGEEEPEGQGGGERWGS